MWKETAMTLPSLPVQLIIANILVFIINSLLIYYIGNRIDKRLKKLEIHMAEDLPSDMANIATVTFCNIIKVIRDKEKDS